MQASGAARHAPLRSEQVTDRTVGFGIVGTGMIAPVHVAAIAECPGARLAAVADAVEDRARDFGGRHGVAWFGDYREMLRDPEVDIVCVCTPSGLRGDIAVDAARAGKHVICEKPLEITLRKADAVISECDRAGVKLAVIMQNRFLEGVQAAKKLMDEGRLGRPVLGDAYVKWYRPQSYYDSSSWRGTWAMDGGGVLINQAIHYIDLLQWMMGPVESIQAITATLARSIEVEDTAVACLRFASGALGVIEACTSAYPGVAAKLELRGEAGTLVLEDGRIVYQSIEGEEAPAASSAEGMGGASNPSAISDIGHIRQIADMVDAVQNDRSPMIDGREGRKAIEIILGIYEASRTGRIVELPLERSLDPSA